MDTHTKAATYHVECLKRKADNVWQAILAGGTGRGDQYRLRGLAGFAGDLIPTSVMKKQKFLVVYHKKIVF